MKPKNGKRDLTDRQQQVLDIVRAHWRTHGVSPTFREVAEAMDTSVNAAYVAVLAVARKGRLETGEGVSGIYPTGLRDAIKALRILKS